MARNIEFFDGAQSGTVPTLGDIEASKLKQYANDAAYEATEGAAEEGDMYANTTDNVIRYYNGTSWLSVATHPLGLIAADVGYDNASSGLTATDTQAAVDEVEARVDTAESNITGNDGDISDLETLSGSAGATDHGTFTGATIPDSSTTKAALQSLETEVELKIDTADIGAINGVAGLDGSGKVPESQLPTKMMEYQGDWNASTNTPTLANTDTDKQGNVYRATVAGSTDFGAGSITFAIGDWCYNNGTTWEKSIETTLPDTDSLLEGATNLYYTEARVTANTSVTANTAKVSADGSVTTHSDVGGAAPNDTEILTYVSANNRYEPQPAPVTGATPQLDNLSAVAINTSLLPDTDNTLNLGTEALSWNIIYGRLFFGGAGGTTNFASAYQSGDGCDVHSGYSNSAANTGQMKVQSGDQIAAGTGTVGNLLLNSGSVINAANSNDSGDIEIEVGTVAGAGSRGTIRIKDGSEGTTGHVLTSIDTNGGVGWAAAGAGSLNQDLSNLTATAANLAINPGVTNSIDIGTASLSWRQTFSRNFLSTVASGYFGSDFNQNLAATFQSGQSNSATNTGNTVITTGDQLSSGSGTVGDLLLQSGSIIEATNANDTGDIIISPGTTAGAGSRGTIKVQDGSEGTSGHVLKSIDTSGTLGWAAEAGGGDAWGDPVDANIVPDVTDSQDLGSATKFFDLAYINNIRCPRFQATDADNSNLNHVEMTGIPQTAPDAVSYQTSIRTIRDDDKLGIWTKNSSLQPSAKVSIQSGNTTASSSDSGDIEFKTGTATANRGVITLDALNLDLKTDIVFDTGAVAVVKTLDTVSATSKGLNINSGSVTSTGSATSGNIDIKTGTTTNSGQWTGNLNLATGNAGSAGSGAAGLITGDSTGGPTGLINIISGDASSGASGDILLETGTATTTRGSISLDALTIEHNKTPSQGVVWENGATGSRPGTPATGQRYFDTTLGQPIWYDGSNWVDATGTTA